MHPFRQLTLAATLATTLGAQAAGGLVITPGDNSIAPGDSFALQVRGTGFTDNVIGGGFNLSFDPGLMALTSVSVDTGVWEFLSSNGQIDNVAGLLSDVYFNSFRAVLPTGDFSVATLQFTALAEGSGAVQLSASPDFPFSDDLGQPIAVGFGGASVAVGVVPEPSTMALWLAGCAVLAGLARRRLA